MGLVRFGVINESPASAGAWRDHVRRVEDAGVDVLLVRDHLVAGPFGPQLAPWTALASAAAATTRLRVGSMVLSNDFRHPAHVAHEALTLQYLSGGRFELGLGAGWYAPEYAAAGLTFEPIGRRIERLEEALQVITALCDGAPLQHDGTHYRIDGLQLPTPPACAPRPRLMVGAGGPRMLRLAARYADTVGILPAPIRGAEDPDGPDDRMPAALERKLEVLDGAGVDRAAPIELSALVTVRVSDHRTAATDALIAERGWSGTPVESVWAMPTILIGSLAQIRADIAERHERFGLSYLVTGDRDLATVAAVIDGL